MNRNITKGLTAGLMAFAMSLIAMTATAADPDTDAFTIRITPSVDYGVNLDTTTTQFDTGDPAGDLDVSLSVGGTNYLISPATVTVTGNFNNQELYVRAVGLDNWTVDADETAGNNEVQLYALFAVDKASRPVEGEFGSDSGRHQVTGTAQYAGEASGGENGDRTDNRYEIPVADMTSGTNMDSLTVGMIKQLWLRVDSPASSDFDTAQQIQVIVSADSGVVH